MSDRAPSAAAQLRKLLAQPGCIVAPGVSDAFAARLVKLEGFGKLGFKLAIYPNWVILAAIPAMQNILREKKTGSIAHMRDQVATFKQFTEIAGLPEIQKLEQKYGLPEDQRAGL